ncbi:MAG: glycosyltransferase family 4 protein [bacterium]
MNIAVVAGYPYPTNFALAERDLRVFHEYRARLGTVVVVVQSPDRDSHRWTDGGVIVHYVPRHSRGLFGLMTFWARAVVAVWRLTRQYDVVVADATDLAGACVLLPLKWMTGLRILLHLQFQFFEMSPTAFPTWKRWALNVGARIACLYADSIRCVTEEIRLQALRVGVDPGKLIVIPTRTDPVLFDPTRVPSRPTGTGYQLLYVGSLTRLKGLNVLLAALPEVLARFPDARLRIVGDGPARPELEMQVARTGLNGKVDFSGYLPYSTLPAVLGAADIFVYPSLSEAMPRAVLEAMAMERPVVASRVGGIPEAMRAGVDGFLVHPGDVQALATAVCKLLGDPNLGRTMGQAGRQRVLERFSFEAGVQALVRWHETWA